MTACGWLVSAFGELSTCRQVGMGVGPIPLTAIQHYADRHELGELFIKQILDMDRQYLIDTAPKQKKK